MAKAISWKYENLSPNRRVAVCRNIQVGDTCNADLPEMERFPNATVHVFGTWGGATLDVKGRALAAADALTHRDIMGNVMSYAADGRGMIAEVLPYLSWVLTGGDVTTDLTVVVVLV